VHSHTHQTVFLVHHFFTGCIGISITGQVANMAPPLTTPTNTPGTPIVVGGGTDLGSDKGGVPRICAAHEDLDPGNAAQPGVFVLDKTTSFIISWETVFFSNPITSPRVQAQMEIFLATGDFDIRWGAIAGRATDRIAAGIDHDLRTPARAIPAVGQAFGDTAAASNGLTIASGPGQPSNMCNSFTVGQAP
jgi:hypothetical protein